MARRCLGRLTLVSLVGSSMVTRFEAVTVSFARSGHLNLFFTCLLLSKFAFRFNSCLYVLAIDDCGGYSSFQSRLDRGQLGLLTTWWKRAEDWVSSKHILKRLSHTNFCKSWKLCLW